MLSYCLDCRKNTENKNLKVVKTKNGRVILLSNWDVSRSTKKKKRFIKEQEAKKSLSRYKITIKSLSFNRS